ncbi:MAG: leucine-rich repeat protein [Firmicutes bacterium]|nr:leucine-rich repeat protein [Bacillota bacterium]
MKHVRLGDDSKIIGIRAFAECTELESVDLPRNCIVISKQAFLNCKKIKRILIPKSVVYVADNAFEGCTDLIIEYEKELS